MTKYSSFLGALFLMLHSCVIPPYTQRTENHKMPDKFGIYSSTDTTSSAILPWKKFFNDSTLIALIDSALRNNQELNIFQNEINIAQNNIRLKKAQYLPFLEIIGVNGYEKPGQYTLNGAAEEQLTIEKDKKFPEPLSDWILGTHFSWELDIWKKLRNGKKAAVYKYLATTEGRNFLVSRLVTEIASLYYDLMALQNQREILQNYVDILKDALEIIRQEKAAARTSELAVQRFEAEVLKNQSKIYYLQQQIIETENKLNFLIGRFPQSISQNYKNFLSIAPPFLKSGIPTQLLLNRPDIKQAALEIQAARLEIKSAKAEFYPSVRLSGIAGYNAYRPELLFITPLSLLWNIAGEMITPVVNRNALKANYFSAIAQQNKATYEFEQKVLNAYIETLNQLNNVYNTQQALELKNKQVETLNSCIEISINLFKNARADYLDVLLTQREALEARFELIEIKKQQMQASINLYRALGGGWR